MCNYINTQLDIFKLGMLDDNSSPDDNLCSLGSGLNPGGLPSSPPGGSSGGDLTPGEHSKVHMYTF